MSDITLGIIGSGQLGSLLCQAAKKLKVIDSIIKEPLGGAHSNREEMFTTLKKVIIESHEELKNLSPKELVEKRMEKYSSMGVFKG